MIADGVVNILKPPGMTSHDVVAWTRRHLGPRKAGHTGTLDPGAAGVLLVCVGRATRLAEYLAAVGKEYVAEVTFGTETDTDDRWGAATADGRTDVNAAEIDAALPSLTGRVMQVPPTISALKHRGKPLYRWARQGQPVTRTARPVEVHSLERLTWDASPPRAMLRVRCGSGTYVRALCRDLGRLVGSAAHMSFLLRTAVGIHHVRDSWTLEELDRWRGSSDGSSPVMDMGDSLSWMPTLVIDDAAAVLRGQSPPLASSMPHGHLVRLIDRGGRLLAVARAEPARRRLALDKVFGGGGDR